MVLLQHRESHMRMMLKDKYPVCLLHDGDLIVFTPLPMGQQVARQRCLLLA